MSTYSNGLLGLADLNPIERVKSWFAGNSFAGGITIILVLVLVILAAFIWAAFFRKPGRTRARRHHHHHRKFPEPPKEIVKEQPGNEETGRSRRGRRHRRTKRLPNPTLAETGGLPPPRTGPAKPPFTS
jgi:hypothetical protein